jgi:hypothetical protein
MASAERERSMKKASSSFLKKRTKKLLSIAVSAELTRFEQPAGRN